MSSYDSTISLMKTAMDATQNKYDKENADNYILRCKNAIVIWYQPMTLIACVRFCGDKNNNEYRMFNYSHAYLLPGDTVKVFYTTNAAKGWIMIRSGKPNYLNEHRQRIDTICNDCGDDSETCCESSCCAEAATQQKDKETVTVEEWTERIEGAEDEIREYEASQANSPFK